MTAGPEPVVARLRVTPVKAFAQAQVGALTLGPRGVVEDRRFVIADADDRVLYSTRLDALAGATADWRPGAGPDGLEGGRLLLRFADGRTAAGEVALGDAVAGRAYAGRPVPGREVLGPFAAALSEAVGRPLRLLHVEVGIGSPGAVTVLGDGSVARLAGELGLERLDPRRFRTTIELSGLAPHEEDTWQGRVLAVGETALRIAGPVPRCALTTRDPDTRARDHDVLRALLAYRPPTANGEPPLGMYATVEHPGVVRVGDPARLLP